MKRPISVAALLVFLAALACLVHYACGCYGPNDKLPSCSTPGACPDYPTAPHDAGH